MMRVLDRESHDALHELPVTTLVNTYAVVHVAGMHARPCSKKPKPLRKATDPSRQPLHRIGRAGSGSFMQRIW